MVATVHTVAFRGVEVLGVEVQAQISSGLPAFNVVGLPDKAVAESRERVRAALHALGLSLPPKRITINLAPADVLKEGSHFDLPIALALLQAMDVLSGEDVGEFTVLGELALDGAVCRVSGVLPAAMDAVVQDRGIICPVACGSEAAWAGDLEVLAPSNLLSLVNHFKGTQVLSRPDPVIQDSTIVHPDLNDVKGQETAKRALEITAAGGHNLLMIGPPGSGKSMLAARLPGILPPLTPAESLEVSMIHSVSGNLKQGQLIRNRVFRDPHHSASLPALIGGGMRAQPGEISLAHKGVLFLDELPEFNRQTLEALRQPLETGRTVIARANYHLTYPARIQLVAAMNPCRCGHLDDAALACSRAPKCAQDYQSKISGPLFDRIDLHVDVPEVKVADLHLPSSAECSADVAKRVAAARCLQQTRYAELDQTGAVTINAEADGKILEQACQMNARTKQLLIDATDKFKLSARGYHRILRVARTIADLTASSQIVPSHMAEALSFRRMFPGGIQR